jgi:hypothetical protein
MKNTSMANNFALGTLYGPLMAKCDTVGDLRREEEAKLFNEGAIVSTKVLVINFGGDDF